MESDGGLIKRGHVLMIFKNSLNYFKEIRDFFLFYLRRTRNGMVGFPYVKRYTLDEHIARTIGDYKGE